MRRQLAVVSAAVLLTGCGIGLSRRDDTGLDDTALGPVQIHGLVPDWGPTAGSTVVTLSGVGFEGDLAVYFDDVSVSAFRNDTTELLVTTPPWPSEGPVEVRVVSALGEDSVPGGYFYSDNGPPPDTGDTGTTGLVGGLVEFSFLQVACPSCVGLTGELHINASAAFHAPTSGSWIDWMPSVGTCAANPASVPLSSQTQDVGTRVYLESGATSHALDRSSGSLGTIYVNDGLTEFDYLRSASWNLTGPVPVTGALNTTAGFDDIQPIQMLYTSPQAAWAAPIRRSGQTFTWQLTGIADRFVIDIVVYNAAGTARIGEVMCVGADSGSMLVPASHLSSYPVGALAVVTLTRYQITRAGTMSDGSLVEGVSWFGVMGTGTIAP